MYFWSFKQRDGAILLYLTLMTANLESVWLKFVEKVIVIG